MDEKGGGVMKTPGTLLYLSPGCSVSISFSEPAAGVHVKNSLRICFAAVLYS